MSLFFDYLWTWIVLTFVVGACGWGWYLNDQRGRNLIIAIVSPLLTLALGLSLYYGIDTDRKSITRMLDTLIAAVEADDYEAVSQFISPKAENVQSFAQTQMSLFRVSKAKYHNLEIEINDATSPPVAHVRFSTAFYLKTKTSYEGFSVDQPIPESVRFEIELEKTKDKSWLITSKFQFFPMRGYQ